MKVRRRLPQAPLGVTYAALYCILMVVYSLLKFPILVFPLLLLLVLLIAGNINAWQIFQFIGVVFCIPVCLFSLGQMLTLLYDGGPSHLSTQDLLGQCLLGWIPLSVVLAIRTKSCWNYFDLKCRRCQSYRVRYEGIIRIRLQCRDCLETWRAQSHEVDTDAFD